MSKKKKSYRVNAVQPEKDGRFFALIIAEALIIIAMAVCLVTVNSDRQNSATETDAETSYESITGEDGNNLPDAVVNSTVTEDGAYELYNGVYLISLDSYSGSYVEDGTDDEVSNIMQATIINTTNTPYIQGEFILTIGGTDYDFAFTTLFPNSTMTVLEQNKTAYTDSSDITDCEISNDGFSIFTYTPSVHLDTFSITYTDNAVNVENTTDEDRTGVYVYYKNIDENGVFQGGITYRVNVGDITAGETVQGTSQHLSQSGSKICFVTWDGMTDE